MSSCCYCQDLGEELLALRHHAPPFRGSGAGVQQSSYLIRLLAGRWSRRPVPEWQRAAVASLYPPAAPPPSPVSLVHTGSMAFLGILQKTSGAT